MSEDQTQNRRDMLRTAGRYLALGGVTVLAGGLAVRSARGRCSTAGNCRGCPAAADCQEPQALQTKYVWQLDPDKCMACGKCQVNCVLDVSAVKCVNCFALCGYCDICTGYYVTDYQGKRSTGVEQQLCPTGAITRTFIEDQDGTRYFEYTIDESLCIGCGKCVKGCAMMNGSFYLQVRHDRCLNCNECAIAVGCPTRAFRRVPAGAPNLLKEKARHAVEALARKRGQAGQGTT